MAKKKKINKKRKRFQFIIWIFLLLLVAFFTYYFKDEIFKPNPNQGNSTSVSVNHPNDHSENIIAYDDFQIHFMELGVYNTGDATYIKAGNTDVLIDAGATAESANYLIEYINQYCLDGKIEYVITTHAHDDHYTGMFGNQKASVNFKNEPIERTGILYYYDIGTIIDFSQTAKTAGNYLKYMDAVNYAVSKGSKHYNALECFTEQNGAKSQYILDDEKMITMDILYNKYYFELSSDENNHSVCTMFHYNDHHFMFTGDLEKDGEEALAQYYDQSSKEKTLPHVDLFKAGHHGSKTSSNDCLLQLITPDICCVCCCAGSSEYTTDNNNVFPTQDFIDRIAKYTDRVYVTSAINMEESRKQGKQIFQSLNGTICVSCNGQDVGVDATNNVLKLKNSEWFNEKIYVVTNEKGTNTICQNKNSSNYYNETDENVQLIPRRTWPSYS